jgi:hypothetical protein
VPQIPSGAQPRFLTRPPGLAISRTDSAGVFLPSMLEYYRRVWVRARKDTKDFAQRKSLGVGLASSVLGIAVAILVDWRLNAGTFSASMWVAGFIGSVAGPLVIITCSFTYFFLQAPHRLDGERTAEIEAESKALSTAKAKIKHLESGQPILAACLHQETARLSLAVTNSGPPAEVWATITIGGETLLPRSGASARWRHTPDSRCLLGRGETRHIIVAESRHEHGEGEDHLSYYWYVPFVENGVLGESRSLVSAFPHLPNPDIHQEVMVEVFSAPATGNPVRFGIVLVGCDSWEKLSGVPLCLPASAPSTPAPTRE